MPKARAPLIAFAVFCAASIVFLLPLERPHERAPQKASLAREPLPALRQPIAAAPRPTRAAPASQPRVLARQAVHVAVGASLDAPPFDPQDIPLAGVEPVYSPDPVMLDADDRPEHRWRATWHAEPLDADWTQRMQEELQQRAASALSGELQITHASCRQTLCLVHLQFEDTPDAEAFQRAHHAEGLHFEYQSFEPTLNEDGTDESKLRYQLVVKRES